VYKINFGQFVPFWIIDLLSDNLGQFYVHCRPMVFHFYCCPMDYSPNNISRVKTKAVAHSHTAGSHTAGSVDGSRRKVTNRSGGPWRAERTGACRRGWADRTRSQKRGPGRGQGRPRPAGGNCPAVWRLVLAGPGARWAWCSPGPAGTLHCALHTSLTGPRNKGNS
jgi:hypothetical protein